MLSQCSWNNIQDLVLFRKPLWFHGQWIIQLSGNWSSFALQHDAKSYSIDDGRLSTTWDLQISRGNYSL
jgi:hypothetical protein